MNYNKNAYQEYTHNKILTSTVGRALWINQSDKELSAGCKKPQAIPLKYPGVSSLDY